ncbi:MAG: sugar phosphate isomerase/epimerase [Clostridiales bacterium]|nr:sugar phosphate isomerase/epimerase [Clostridiales bacterium]
MKFSAIYADGSFPCNTAVLQGALESCMEAASQYGYDGIQLTIRDTSDYSVDELKGWMEKYHLSLSALATGRVYTVDGLSMGHGNEENRRACVERMFRLADFSEQLGCPALVIGAVRGCLQDAPTPEIYYQQFDRSVRELVAYCEPKNIPVILEVNDHNETDVYCDPAETSAYVAQVNSPCFYMYLDTMHIYYEGQDPAEVISRYGKESFQVDISGEERKAPMDSVIDFQAVAKALKTSGFDGWVSFEIPPSTPEDSAKYSLEYIREKLAEA